MRSPVCFLWFTIFGLICNNLFPILIKPGLLYHAAGGNDITIVLWNAVGLNHFVKREKDLSNLSAVFYRNPKLKLASPAKLCTKPLMCIWIITIRC